jgi:hypothetical protein
MYFTIKIILKNNYITFKRGVNINEYMKTLKRDSRQLSKQQSR